MQNLSCFSIILRVQHSKQDFKGASLRLQNFRVQKHVLSGVQNFRVQKQLVCFKGAEFQGAKTGSRVQNFSLQVQIF